MTRSSTANPLETAATLLVMQGDPSGSEYALAWPKLVAAEELAEVIRRPLHGSAERARLLVQEMFAYDVPVADLAAVLADAGTTSEYSDDEAAQAFLAALARTIGGFPEHRTNLPYYGQATPDGEIDVQRSWRQMVMDLRLRGYLERAAPEGCNDNPPHRDQDDRLNSITRARIGLRDIWPIITMRQRSNPLPAEDFYRLVELVHDLLARPRRRQEHPGCGWHYQEFAAEPAKALYRARVNDLFARAGVHLQVSVEGEDLGRLIRIAGDTRDELVHLALAVLDEGDRDAVAHAVARFRDRAVTRDDKRAAIVALARVLENRRRLLEVEMLSRDEGALFNIANNFDLRHRGANQQADYDEAFLDWVFWWYLATVELIDRLTARPDTSTS